MKTILLMRHAKSSWDGKNQDDRERPLSKRGRKTAEHIGKLLSDEKLIPNLIVFSSAVRASQTADIVKDELKYRGDYCSLNKLYMAEVDAYKEVIHNIPDDVQTVLIVSHNPGLETLLQMVTGKIESLPTSAVAHLQVNIDSWSDFSLETQGELLNLWRPKELS